MPGEGGAKSISNPSGAYGYASEAVSQRISDELAAGFSTLPRWLADNSAVAVGTSTCRWSYFTAPYSLLSTTVRSATGTSATGTPTLVRVGLYLVDALGNLTLVASTANDTALWASANTAYTKSWSNPYQLQSGQRYAVTGIVVGASPCTLLGRQPGSALAAEFALPPVLASSLSGQSDLPATVAVGSLTNIGGYAYFAFV